LRLLDGRRVRRQSGKRAVDIPLIQILELLDHLFRQLFIRMDDAKLRRRLDKGSLCLADRRESLMEIGRHLTEVSAGRLRRQAQRGTDLMNIRRGLLHLRLRFREHRLPSIIFLPADRPIRQQLLCAAEIKLCQLECCVAFVKRGDAGVQQSHSVLHVLHGVLQFPT
jgi:hypothetical protein